MKQVDTYNLNQRGKEVRKRYQTKKQPPDTTGAPVKPKKPQPVLDSSVKAAVPS